MAGIHPVCPRKTLFPPSFTQPYGGRHRLSCADRMGELAGNEVIWPRVGLLPDRSGSIATGDWLLLSEGASARRGVIGKKVVGLGRTFGE